MFITKRKSGYYYLFYTDEITGKRKGITTKTKIKSEALKYLTGFKSTKSANIVSVSYLNDFQDAALKYSVNNLSPASVQIYKKVLNKLILIIGNRPLKYITAKDIEYYKDERLKSINKTTVNIEIRTLKAIFNLAIKWCLIEKNPLNQIKQFSLPQKEILSFSDFELKILLASINDIKFKNIVYFALYTGCRISEILNAQWKDIDFGNKIFIVRNKTNFKTKSGKIRQIPISENLMRLLKSMLNQDNSNVVNYYDPDSFVFCNKFNLNYNRGTISEKFREYIKGAGLPQKFHFHSLRHTFITNLIKKGVNINFVKEIAGHSAISTTMNYIHLATEDLRDAVNKINF